VYVSWFLLPGALPDANRSTLTPCPTVWKYSGDDGGLFTVLGHFPDDPQTLGMIVANCVVIGADPGAEAANIFYYHRAQPLVATVVDTAMAHPDEALREAVSALRHRPADPVAYAKTRDLVSDEVIRSPESVRPLCEAAWTAISRSRLDYWVGQRYCASEEIRAADLLPTPQDAAIQAPVGTAAADVLVVVPFRDRSAEGTRVRNLLACLRSLRDQRSPANRYRVCVVESDDSPRWRDTIAPLAHDYLFAAKSGAFNKCWAVNVGVRHASGAAELICVLDADALVDRHFVARNAERFRRPGTGGFLPFRDLLYLDADASNYGIGARCRQGAADLDPARTRGFLVHRAPGLCVWVRRDVFLAIDGMDERYEGWGREDMDFLLRLQLATAFVQFDDPMYHLHHPSSAHLVDGQTVNAHIPWLSWRPDSPIGDLHKFATTPA
jgi:hypothetical protein